MSRELDCKGQIRRNADYALDKHIIIWYDRHMKQKEVKVLTSGPSHQYSFYLNALLVVQVRLYAEKVGRSASWVVRQALLEYLLKEKEASASTPKA